MWIIEDLLLEDIYFGSTDGLKESKRDNFEEMFYKDEIIYNQLTNDNDKFIISGKKGTGKTILAQYYLREKRKNGAFTGEINGKDILLSQLREIGCGNISESAMCAFIEFNLWFKIAEIIIENKKEILKKSGFITSGKIKRLIRKSEKMLQIRYGCDNFRLKEIIEDEKRDRDISVNFSQDKLFNKIAGAGAAGNFTNSLGKKTTYVINEYFNITDVLKPLLLPIIRNTDISVVIDDLDEYSNTQFEHTEFLIFINKLIYVINDINTLLNRNNPGKCKIVVLLRSDIIDGIQSVSGNINKIISESRIFLNWMDYNYQKTPWKNKLMDLILTKVRNSSDKLKGLNTRQVYEKIFPEKVRDTYTFTYLLNGSEGRPRDVIMLLNIIRQNNLKERAITGKMFISAEREYSKAFRDDMKNEMALFYPNEWIVSAFKIMSLINKSHFKIEDVENVIKECGSQISPVDDARVFVDRMYESGAIGNYWREGKNKKYSFKYYEHGRNEPDYRATFVMHIGLRKYLL